jgi:hypothetical protein
VLPTHHTIESNIKYIVTVARITGIDPDTIDLWTQITNRTDPGPGEGKKMLKKKSAFFFNNLYLKGIRTVRNSKHFLM